MQYITRLRHESSLQKYDQSNKTNNAEAAEDISSCTLLLLLRDPVVSFDSCSRADTYSSPKAAGGDPSPSFHSTAGLSLVSAPSGDSNTEVHSAQPGVPVHLGPLSTPSHVSRTLRICKRKARSTLTSISVFRFMECNGCTCPKGNSLPETASGRQLGGAVGSGLVAALQKRDRQYTGRSGTDDLGNSVRCVGAERCLDFLTVLIHKFVWPALSIRHWTHM